MKHLIRWQILILPVLLMPAAVHAAVDNLTTDMPTQLEDAFPTTVGTTNLLLAGTHQEMDDGSSRFETIVEGRRGVIPGLQLSAEARFLSGSASETGSGDVALGVQYLLLPGPFLAVEGDVILPTGEDNDGADTRVKLLISQPLGGTSQALHANLSWDRNDDSLATEREHRYAAVLGASGKFTQEIVWVADLVRREERERDKESNLFELGLRVQPWNQFMFSVGAGVGFADESPDYTVTVALQATL